MLTEIKIVRGEPLQSLYRFGDNCFKVTKFTINNCPNVTNIEQFCDSMESLVELIVDDGSILVIDDIKQAFRYTSNLTGTSLDFLTTRIINATSLNETFSYTGADIPVFDTSNIEDLRSAFAGFKQSAFKSGWDFGNVTNAERAFDYALFTTFPVIDFPKCTQFFSTWYYCQNLVDFPIIDVSKGENFSWAWYRTTALRTFASDANMNCMLDFSSATTCSSGLSYTGLIDAPLLNMTNPSGTLCTNMFSNSTNLKTARGWTLTSVVQRFIATYRWCTALECIGDYPIATVYGDYGAFVEGCSSLETIKSINTTNGAHTNDDMFIGCTSLTSPNASEQNAISSTGGTVYNSGIECPHTAPPP